MPLIPGSKGKRKINIKEKKFVQEYIKRDFVKKHAALATYNVKPTGASQLANQVLKRPVVQQYLSEQLAKVGLGLEDLNGYMATSIKSNLESGKPSQAVAASLIQFGYKLHNALPANKTVSARINLNSTITPENMSELQKKLEEITQINQKLLEEIKK